MSAIILGIITFICVLGGTITGMLVRNKLPDDHLSGDSRDAVKMASGLIATLGALVLGLLVSSAKTSFDDMNNAVTQSSAKVIMLDKTLAQYGPETAAIRDELRNSITKWITLVWPEHKTDKDAFSTFEKSPATMDIIAAKLRELKPQNDAQREFQAQGLGLCRELLQTRWLIIEQAQVSMPMMFIVVLLFWFTILFGSIGLFAPSNKTVMAAMFVCAMSVGGALFLIEEMNRPLTGIVKISSAPFIKAVEHIGKTN